jgi:hypothetical protein
MAENDLIVLNDALEMDPGMEGTILKKSKNWLIDWWSLATVCSCMHSSYSYY